jgi:hypothetical protein
MTSNVSPLLSVAAISICERRISFFSFFLLLNYQSSKITFLSCCSHGSMCLLPARDSDSRSIMSNPLDKRGKALEEDYFRRRERELIEKMRAKMAAEQRASEALQCPRGDGALVEVTFEGIKIDLCETCGGAWLDAGELEGLTKQDDDGWLSRLWGSSEG